MSSCRETADEIQEKLLDMGFTVHRLDSFTTNSVYLKVDCGVCHSIRVSDHRGKKHLKYRYNIGSYVRKFRSVHDMHRRYYFTVDEVDRRTTACTRLTFWAGVRRTRSRFSGSARGERQ